MLLFMYKQHPYKKKKKHKICEPKGLSEEKKNWGYYIWWFETKTENAKYETQ